MLDQITPLIITYNEAPNIRRTLGKLTWARRIVVIDSGSTDETVEIVRSHPQAEAIEHAFVDFASQCNFGLSKVDSLWVMSLDADYEVSDELLAELERLAPSQGVAGYQARFRYRIYGRQLRGTLYPPRTVLYRTKGALYCREGHGHRVVVDGEVRQLDGFIYHDDRKPLVRWLASHQRYARDEAQYLLSRRGETLTLADRLRLIGWPAPFMVFIYVLFVKRCLLDGWPGLFYALQRCLAEALLALEIVNRRIEPLGAEHSDSNGRTR